MQWIILLLLQQTTLLLLDKPTRFLECSIKLFNAIFSLKNSTIPMKFYVNSKVDLTQFFVNIFYNLVFVTIFKATYKLYTFWTKFQNKITIYRARNRNCPPFTTVERTVPVPRPVLPCQIPLKLTYLRYSRFKQICKYVK